jgi:hypothetical protein
MKHIKLFEGYESEEAPFSITIELTDGFEEHTRQSKNSDGARGYTSMVSPITLVNNGDRYNMVKVATIPWDIKRNIQFDFWASYRPKAEEIYVTQSSASANDLKRIESAAHRDELRSSQPILSDVGEKGNSIFSPGYYCKFENGFKVGEVDHRGYFKIVAVK